MQIDISQGDFKRLLDLAYVGSIVLGVPDPDSREAVEYDRVMRSLFGYCPLVGLGMYAHIVDGEVYPSDAYAASGILDKLLDYEDATMFDILAEELARRDLEGQDVDGRESDTLQTRIGEYLAEFDQHGLDNVYTEGI